MGKIGEQLTVVALALVGLAVIAVIVSNRATTANLLGALGGAFSSSLNAAISPVGGSSL